MLIADAALTVAWQEPVSAYYAHRTQGHLNRDLAGLRARPAAGRRAARRAPSSTRAAAWPTWPAPPRRRVKDGQALGRIKIPKIGASYVVVQGTDAAALRKGPGHYPETPLPGHPRDGGHRRAPHDLPRAVPPHQPPGQGRPDRPRHALRPLPLRGREDARSSRPTRLYVIRRVDHDRLVLSACHPLYRAAQADHRLRPARHARRRRAENRSDDQRFRMGSRPDGRVSRAGLP